MGSLGVCKGISPPKQFGLQASQQPGLRLLQLQNPHLTLHAREVQIQGKTDANAKGFDFSPKPSGDSLLHVK